jgi:hypothetical protein
MRFYSIFGAEDKLQEEGKKYLKKDFVYFIAGLIVFLFASFYGRDLSNQSELLTGAIIFIAISIMGVIWWWIRGHGGTFYPVR